MSHVPAVSHDTTPVVASVDVGIELARQAERDTLRSVLTKTAIAVPLCMGIWVLIVFIALVGDGWRLDIPLVVPGLVVGAFAGLFFGGWAGFVAKAHALDEADREAAHLAHGA